MVTMEHKIVVINAAASGIGLETAKAFARCKATLVVSDINEEALAAAASELRDLGGTVSHFVCNMSNPTEVDALFEKVFTQYPKVDVLINNVGIAGPTKPIEDITLEEWDRTMGINVRGAFQCIKAVVPSMKQNGGGRIVSMSSMSGRRPLPFRTPYCAAKMAIIGMTRTLAAELGEYNILVNAVCPGSVSGGRLNYIIEQQAKLENRPVKEVYQEYVAPSPLKRFVDPEMIARTILFLASDENTAITGEDVNVTAGVCMF